MIDVSGFIDWLGIHSWIDFGKGIVAGAVLLFLLRRIKRIVRAF